MKLVFKKQILIFSIALISYLALAIYTPIHTVNMNDNHDMNMPKKDCPFLFADNLLCNSLIKKDSDLIYIINHNFSNSFSYIFLYEIILFIILFISIYMFFRFLFRLKDIYKIQFLTKELFSSGILNSKAF